jgi:hypothetical protein
MHEKIIKKQWQTLGKKTKVGMWLVASESDIRMHEMKNKTKSASVVAWRRKETKDEWCMVCSLYNGVSGRCVRIRDQCTACARSNGEMHMHSYHGDYPTISHTYNTIVLLEIYQILYYQKFIIMQVICSL